MNTSDQLLALVRTEASKFGRCCDQYQDSGGTFCCHECGQRTMAMLKGVQELLGIRKGGEPVDCEAETKAAHDAAVARSEREARLVDIDIAAWVNAMRDKLRAHQKPYNPFVSVGYTASSVTAGGIWHININTSPDKTFQGADLSALMREAEQWADLALTEDSRLALILGIAAE